MSAATTPSISEAYADRLVAGFTALAVAIHVLEAAFPSPLPGVKPGLANVITLIVLLRYGWRLAVWVGLLRVLAGSLLAGTFLTPTFVLSFSGQAASLLLLGLAWLLARGWLSVMGLAWLAAMGHMAGQIAVAWLLFVPHPVVWQLAPLLIAAALGLGTLSGIIARGVLERLPPRPC